MPKTSIASLWTPQIWVDALREQQATFPSVINSGIAARREVFDGIATGPGTSANIPTWKDITDLDEEIQVESTGPAVQGITAAPQVCTILNRVSKFAATALSAAVSGGDPVTEIIAQLAENRAKRRQKTLLSILRGAMGTGSATPNQAVGALRAMRKDIFIENGNGAGSNNIVSVDSILETLALLGELKNGLIQGAMTMHTNIVLALEKLDAASFKDGVESGLPFTVRTYRGIPIFVSDSLVRAGATSGFVYDTYIFAPSVVGVGERPQVADSGETVDVSALQFDTDKDINDQILYDRTRYLMHLNGTKWVGTPAGQSATNAELATVANWELVFSSAQRCGVACLRSNG